MATEQTAAHAVHPAHEAESHAVVDSVKMPKIKIDNHKVADINAFATAFASFFGFATIIAAISTFTKGKWSFNIPFLGSFLGSNLGQTSSMLVVALLTLACAIIGLMTVRKITDAEAMKKAWSCVAKVFGVFVIIFCVDMVAVLIYSLLSLGRSKFAVSQGELWGSSFVANLILALASAAMFFVSAKIAKGETKYLSIMRFVAIGIASVATLMAVVSLLVSFYSKTPTTEVEDAIDSLNDLYKYWSK